MRRPAVGGVLACCSGSSRSIDAAAGPGFLRAACVPSGWSRCCRRTDADRHRRLQAHARVLVDGAHGPDRRRRGRWHRARDRRAAAAHARPTASARPCCSSAAGSCRPRTAPRRDRDITGVLRPLPAGRRRFGVGILALLGHAAVRVFASELAIARSLADAGLAWALAVGMLLIVVGVRRAGPQHRPDAARRTGEHGAPPIAAPATVAAALLVGSSRRCARHHRWPADRPAHAAAGHVGASPMTTDVARRSVAADELADAAAGAAGVRASGSRWSPPTTTATACASCTCSWPADPDRRVELDVRRARERSAAAVAGVPVVPGRAASNARWHDLFGIDPSAIRCPPTGPARALAAGLVPDAPRRRPAAGIRADAAASRS